MADFSIEFEETAAPKSKHALAANGSIQIGDFRERFEASVEFWSKSNYRSHWKKSIRRIIDMHGKSCLITSLTDPKSANFLFWWPIYRIGDFAYFQNQVLFFDQIVGPFDPNDPYPHVRDRLTVTEDGSPISEWLVPISSLFRFIEKEVGGRRTGQNDLTGLDE
jgi:hypothetical protein